MSEYPTNRAELIAHIIADENPPLSYDEVYELLEFERVELQHDLYVALSYHLSEAITTREHYENARRYLHRLVESTLDFNIENSDNLAAIDAMFESTAA